MLVDDVVPTVATTAIGSRPARAILCDARPQRVCAHREAVVDRDATNRLQAEAERQHALSIDECVCSEQ